MTSDCCTPNGYRWIFSERSARAEAKRYRRKGLDATSRRIVDFVKQQGVEGRTVLEVGGGIGAIEIELLEAGAARVTNIELAATYEDTARALLAERGLSERADRRVGDFVAEADAIEPHDVVVMHRVVCCYPDVDALVGTAADRARRRMVLTYPQERPAVRAAFWAGNALMRLRGSTFRAFVHPVRRIETAAEAHGLMPETRVRHGFLWESAAFSRR